MFLRKKKEKTISLDIVMPVNGEAKPISDSRDEVFASGSMGNGVVILPHSNELYSPVDGVVSVVFPTGHAYGLSSDTGVEILLHIGIDTVELEGKGFQSNVKQGQKVKQGQLLGMFDREFIEGSGYDSSIMMVITNHKSVDISYGEFEKGTCIMKSINE